jgi:hypothetical protein
MDPEYHKSSPGRTPVRERYGRPEAEEDGTGRSQLADRFGLGQPVPYQRVVGLDLRARGISELTSPLSD